MNAREKTAKITKLRKQIAQLEAKLGGLREDLARLEREPGDTSPLSGLDLLWQAALPKSRERSSRQQCRVAWHRIPQGDRPKLEVAIAALKAWNRCEQWTKDACDYAPGLHRFISQRMWEDLPEVRDPLSKYRAPKSAPAPAPAAEDLATPADISAILGNLTRKVRNDDTEAK
ncbi:hypothetical protein [Luteolibacter marinus]|uniref:hypothetical protein n=1 Tax=Luteolibacter marinus TaxID=2776705 RepID=UPI001867BABF|nr:hypothetical protein [Luteolibacter marinus]